MFPILNPPPSSLPIPSLRVIPVHQPQASSIGHRTWTATHFTHDITHVSMPFSELFPPSPSLTESIRLFYTSVSLLLSRTQGYCYHLSKFHIYALVYCIGVFLSNIRIYRQSGTQQGVRGKKPKSKKETQNQFRE